VVAIDARTGAELWRSTGGDVFALAVLDGTVLVGRGDGTLTAVDAATGASRWQQTVAQPRLTAGASHAVL
jgi:outer membrane protein assembly factor BamB